MKGKKRKMKRLHITAKGMRDERRLGNQRLVWCDLLDERVTFAKCRDANAQREMEWNTNDTDT